MIKSKIAAWALAALLAAPTVPAFATTVKHTTSKSHVRHTLTAHHGRRVHAKHHKTTALSHTRKPTSHTLTSHKPKTHQLTSHRTTATSSVRPAMNLSHVPTIDGMGA